MKSFSSGRSPALSILAFTLALVMSALLLLSLSDDPHRASAASILDAPAAPTPIDRGGGSTTGRKRKSRKPTKTSLT